MRSEGQTPAPAADSHFAYLDGWRGLAIALLLLGHFFPLPGINFGRLGVDLFFVLSGFLMSRILFIKNVPIGLFYRRRIARIFPVHFIFLLLILVYFFVAEKTINWAEVFSAAFFVNNYFQGAVGHNVMPLGHIWSLSVEEHAYVFLSLIAVASRLGILNAKRSLFMVSIIMVLIGCIYSWMIARGTWNNQLWLHTEVAAYGIVISGVLLLHFHTRPIPQLPALAYPGLFFVCIALQWWSIPAQFAMFIGVGILAVLVNLLSAAPQSIKSLLSIAPLRQLGLWSFSLYVWQQPFYLASRHNGLPASVALVGALAAGICSYYLVERPVRNYLNKKWRPKSKSDLTISTVLAK